MKSFCKHALFILVALTSSCAANKPLSEKETSKNASVTMEQKEPLLDNIETFQIPEENQIISNEAPLIIQSNDILSISLSSRDNEALAPFKVTYTTGDNKEASDKYLVNKAGEIEFPTIGKIQIKGLEIEAVKQKIITLLDPYFIKPPIVKIQLTNFRVNVNGEVKSSGSFVISNPRLTIIEAVTMAGDFTRYANRDSVLVIREQNGIREFGHVNFNSSDIFTSNYFYLKQNDVIHVRGDGKKLKKSEDKTSN